MPQWHSPHEGGRITPGLHEFYVKCVLAHRLVEYRHLGVYSSAELAILRYRRLVVIEPRVGGCGSNLTTSMLLVN